MQILHLEMHNISVESLKKLTDREAVALWRTASCCYIRKHNRIATNENGHKLSVFLKIFSVFVTFLSMCCPCGDATIITVDKRTLCPVAYLEVNFIKER